MYSLKFNFARIAFAVLVLTLAFGTAASADTTFRIVIDDDNAPATGCNYSPPVGTGFMGGRWMLVAVVDNNGAITSTELRQCSGGVFNLAGTSSWAIDLDVLPGGVDVLEASLPLNGLRGTFRIGYFSDNGGITPVDFDAVAPFSVVAPVILGTTDIPTLGTWGFLVLALGLSAAGLLVLRRRRRGVGAMLGVLLVLAGAGVVWAAVITVDGNPTDWDSVPVSPALAVASDTPDNDAVSDVDIQGVRAVFDMDALFFRTDVDNEPPMADDQNVPTAEDTPVGITLTGSDPDSDPLTFTVLTNPTNGMLTGTPPNLTYTPNLNFNGSDSFTFQVDDGNGGTDTETVSITVNGANDPPTITSPAAVSVPENQTGVVDVQSTDPEGETEGAGLTYSLTGGVDQALFSIVPATGVLTFNSAPDFENPGDAGANNVYDVQVTVTDSGTLTAVQNLQVTVTNTPDPPMITSPAAVSVPENQTAVIDVQSTDPDGDMEGAGLTYSLTGGADQTLFSIVPATGVLTFNSAPDFENPGDAGGNNVYDVQVTVTDSTAQTGIQNLQATVTDVNESPSITSAAAVSVPENQTAVIDVQSTDPDGDTEGAGLTYSLTGGADQALFSIVPATGVLTFNTAPDFEAPGDVGANNVYDVQVTVTDSGTLTDVQNLQVTVTDTLEPPTITSPAAVSVPENQTAVIDVQSTDPDGDMEGSGLTYSLTGGADQALFSIVPATGVLTFNSPPNFEAPGDVGANNVYEVQVTVTDSDTQTAMQNLQVTVTDATEAPSITSAAAVSVPENQTAVIDVQSTDPDGDTEGAGLTYSLTGGADQLLFSIVPGTGVLTFNSPPNFEAPGDVGANNVYEVQVTVTDSDTLTGMQNLQVTVTDTNEAPSITSAAAVSVPENQTAVIDVQSIDPDGDTEGAGLTYSLGGVDQALFSIVPATGVLTFNSPPNFEAPGDVGANNVYDVQITVTDSDTLTGVQNLQVTVTDANEAPSITSAAAVSVPENQTAVIDVQSTDPDGDTEGAGLTYSLGGVDQALFSIVPATGVLTFNSPPNFEAPGDAGANNVYDVQITVTDSDTLTGVQNLQVTVTDANEAPSITSAAAVSVPENQTAVIDVQSIDPDGDTEGAGLTYSLGGVDQALFSIVPATGVLTFNSPPNFEAPGDAGANNVYDVQVTVTDSDTLTGVQNLQVTVTDANEAPSITSAAAVSVPENQTAVIDVQSIDPDGDTEGAGLTYSLGGVDQALFSIVPATGVLTFNSPPNFEAPGDAGANNVYDVQVTVTDSDTLTGVQNLQVTVTDANEAPSITSAAAVSVPENQTAAIDVQSIDPDGDTEGAGLTYSLGGVDQALFSIVPATGVLTFNSPPNFEAPGDAGANNVYDVQVTVTDSDTLTGVQNLQVTVTNVNEPPTANPDTANITEEAPNVAAANTVSGNVLANDTDPELVPLTVSAVAGGSVGSPRAGTYGSVTINSNGSFTYTLDDTNPAVNALQPGGMLTDSFGYTAFDGSFTSSSTLMVTIHGADDPATPDNDAHDFIGNTQLEVDRDTAATPEVIANTPPSPPELGVLDGDMDPDGGSPLTIAGIVGCGDLTAPFDCVLPGQGTVSLQADGSFSFVPEPGDIDPTANFQYTLVGNPVSATVTFTRFERVWYVKNDAPAGGNGTSVSPFNAITAANLSDNDSDGDLTDDLDSAGDYIFVYFGNGTATNQSGGLVLENNQHLIGQHAGLSIPVNLNSNGSPTNLVTPVIGSRPLLDDTVVDAFEGVSARNVIPAEIVGMNLAGNVNGIDWTTTAAFAGTGDFSIRDNVVRSATNEGVDINLVGTGATRLAFNDNSLTATGNGLDIQETGTGALTITGFANNVVSGNTGGSGIFISNAIFDNVPGGSLDTVSGGTTVIGASGNPAGTNLTHGGLWLDTVSGSLSFTDLDIFAAGFGLAVVGTGPFTGAAGMSIQVVSAPPDDTGTSTLVANDGAAIGITNATVDLRLALLTSTPTTFSTSGVQFDNVAGQFRAPSGSSITKGSGNGVAFQIDNGAAGTTVLTSVYAGTINNSSASARAVRINNADSGSSATFTGSVTETGQGISLTNNTGATVSFSGGLSASTGSNPAFAATGGGTLSVCDENPCNVGATGALVNTLTTTSGTALNVANTTISANSLEFRSISANGASNGITLNTTGNLGGLSVKGTGTAGSGGTIQNITNRGASFVSAINIALTNMNFTNANTADGATSDGVVGGNENTDENGAIHLQDVTQVDLVGLNINGAVQHGINGNNVTDLDVSATIQNTGDEVWESGIYIFDLKGVASAGRTNVFDNVNITNDSGQFNIALLNDDGTNDRPAEKDRLELTNSQLTRNGNNPLISDNVTILNSGTGNFQVVVSGSTFASTVTCGSPSFTGACVSDNIQVDAGNTAAFDAVISSGNSFTNGNAGQSAVNISASGAGQGTFNVSNIVTTVRASQAINVALTTTNSAASLRGTIANNNLSTSVTNNAGTGIQMVLEGNGTMVVDVNNNTINGNGSTDFDYGIRGGARAGSGVAHFQVNNNNVPSAEVAGVWFFAGNATAGETSQTCANFVSNLIDGDPVDSFTDYFTEMYTGTTFQLQGLAGSGANATNVQNFIAGTDDDPSPTDPTVNANSGTTVNYTNAVCQTP